jgi:hypothetical protein
MGLFDFLRGAGKKVDLKPESLKTEINEIGYNAGAYEVLVDGVRLSSLIYLQISLYIIT